MFVFTELCCRRLLILEGLLMLIVLYTSKSVLTGVFWRPCLWHQSWPSTQVSAACAPLASVLPACSSRTVSRSLPSGSCSPGLCSLPGRGRGSEPPPQSGCCPVRVPLSWFTPGMWWLLCLTTHTSMGRSPYVFPEL